MNWLIAGGVAAIFGVLFAGAVTHKMKLTSQQIAQYARNAGFSGDDLVTAVAIALAESGGKVDAPGDYSNGVPTSIGLWQIHYTVHPEYDKERLKEPQYNADAAFALYSKRGGFKDWSTFTGWTPNGYVDPPYLAHLDNAQQGVSV